VLLHLDDHKIHAIWLFDVEPSLEALAVSSLADTKASGPSGSFGLYITVRYVKLIIYRPAIWIHSVKKNGLVWLTDTEVAFTTYMFEVGLLVNPCLAVPVPVPESDVFNWMLLCVHGPAAEEQLAVQPFNAAYANCGK
jgi:hypothetical protein